MKRLVVILLVLAHAAPLAAQWQRLDGGLEYRRSADQKSHFFRVDPKKHRLDLLLARDFRESDMTAETYRERSGALLVINGGFFDESFRSLGLLQRRGRIENRLRDVSWGIFSLGGKEGRDPSIVTRKDWRGDSLLAIQCGPRLVVDGKVTPSFKESEPSRRSAIGVTADHRVVIALSEGLISLQEWAAQMAAETVQALNLDGGGSTQISVSVPPFSLRVIGATGVPNAVGLFR